jgi:hypothetical protein
MVARRYSLFIGHQTVKKDICKEKVFDNDVSSISPKKRRWYARITMTELLHGF